MRAKTTAIATLAAVVVAAVAACSTGSPGVGPTKTVTATVSAPASSSAPASPSAPPSVSVSSTAPARPSAPASSCAINPSTAPLPSVEPYATVPEVGRISVTLGGIPSGSIAPGSAPTEVDVTLCNDSAVDYPQVGVVLVLGHCSCAPNPMSIPLGTVERFDETTGGWIPMEHPAAGTGMDYLGAYSNTQDLPKGKTVALRYRIALDASMTAGDGGVEAVAVIPEPLAQIGNADLSFTVVS